MRIALVSPLFESVPPRFYGGTERVIFNLCKGLTRAGIDVTLFAPGDSNAPGTLIPTVQEAFRLGGKPIHDSAAYNLRLLATVARHAEEFDVIHNHNDYWMLPLSEMSDTPLLTTLHGQLDLPDIPAAFMSYPNCHYVSISDSQRGPLALLNWSRTILHGIAAEDFVFHPQPGKYLAFLGRIGPQKRPEWAIEMAKQSGVPLKIAAKIEGAEGQSYYDTFVKPHVDGNFIEYVGEISEGEKSAFLGNALALAFPIDWPEPFGLVMVEALACGTPVLARPCGAAPEVLFDGITGYSHVEIRELAKRIRDIPKLDRRACRTWIEEHFSIERMTEDYIDVYQQLAHHKSVSGGGRPSFTDRHGDRRAVGDRRNFLHSI